MTFKVEAGKRYVRRDGSVMGKPLETSTHADLRSKYPFFDPGIPTHIKTNGFALAESSERKPATYGPVKTKVRSLVTPTKNAKRLGTNGLTIM